MALLLALSFIFKDIGITEYIVVLLSLTLMCMIFIKDMEIKLPFTVDVNSVQSPGNGFLSMIKYINLSIIFGVAHSFIYGHIKNAYYIEQAKLFTFIYFVYICILIAITIYYYYFKVFKFNRIKIYRGKTSSNHKI
ncbi:hypothetical protein PL321_07500 [Caloramator sp. mosi_1]|uniref:hypothetical protein n=1 Tax=Caloramator sp. mosi_1 TaxID=3023090 RepID=UPI0023631442|nr:hypothetical protein [Caloramator sp. mosi_1]WDC85279.1 hypothetical protein PL321_07500 [Caloramator sp. mosi_1]